MTRSARLRYPTARDLKRLQRLADEANKVLVLLPNGAVRFDPRAGVLLAASQEADDAEAALEEFEQSYLSAGRASNHAYPVFTHDR